MSVPLLSNEMYTSRGVVNMCFHFAVLFHMHSNSFFYVCLLSFNSAQVATHKVDSSWKE